MPILKFADQLAGLDLNVLYEFIIKELALEINEHTQ